ncbi:hypothetical protein [Vreelandella alkaliphila]|uniref:hypothetical protein n=1 Tax=Vreelandella alkaliphila TaxID=272774 RepID=UPI003FD812EF
MSKQGTVPNKFAPNWLSQLDGRRGVTQELRQRYTAMTNDLGGAERLSYAQRSLVERALWLEYWLQTQEVELAEGKAFDVGRWTQAANSLQGILSKLGLERKAKDVPNLQDYLAAKGGTQ